MAVETEGTHRCGSCLQSVGTVRGGKVIPYRRFMGDDGKEHLMCDDREACDGRWRRVKQAERDAASEARAWFPEPDDDDDE